LADQILEILLELFLPAADDQQVHIRDELCDPRKGLEQETDVLLWGNPARVDQ
jgi:hypothetical protein